MDWDFLAYMMGRLGFSLKLINWIRVYLESATILVLVNGNQQKNSNLRGGLGKEIR